MQSSGEARDLTIHGTRFAVCEVLRCAQDHAIIIAGSATPFWGSDAPGTIDAAAPNETIRVEAGVHAGPIMINKPLTLIGEPGAEIRGNGTGNVITITADDVTVRGLRITGSGLQFSDDDAAIFVTGNRATIENNVIADSLHGIYLKKVSGAQILDNRIQGKTTLPLPPNRSKKESDTQHGKLRHDTGRQIAAATAFTSGIAKEI